MSDGSGFNRRAQTAGTDFDFLRLTILINRRFLNIRFPLPFGVPHRVTDVMTVHRFLTTNITFSHDELP